MALKNLSKSKISGAGAKAPEKGKGEDMAKLIKIDRNGTKYYEGYKPCSRCDGKGYYVIGVCNNQPVLSPLDSGICWKCGGSKVEWGKWKEYTPEYEAKLEERRRKRAEKLQAEQEAEEKRLEEERARIKAEEEAERKRKEALEAEQKAKSKFVGSVGEKLEIVADYMFTAFYERKSFTGFGTERVNIHTFRDMDENIIVWKTTASLGYWDSNDDWVSIQENTRVTIKGTVKEHAEYKGEKQTILTRCKVTKR